MAIRRLFTSLLAAAFILSGSAVHASLMAPVVAQDHQASVAATADAHLGHAVDQDHGGDHAGVTADEHEYGQPQDIDHGDNCLDCCNMCGVTTITAEERETSVTFAYGSVRFQMCQRDLLGHLVALDPKIPKSIV